MVTILSECTLSLYSKKNISNNTAAFVHKTFKETKFSLGKDVNNYRLAFQEYHYEENLSATDGRGRRAEGFTERKALVSASNELKLLGKIARDFLSCDKHVPCIGLIVEVYPCGSSPNNFVGISDDAARHCIAQII